MNVLYGTVYEDRPVSGMTTLNDRILEMLAPRVSLRLLTSPTAAASGQRARGSTVETVRHGGYPAIRVERDARQIDRCTAPGDNAEIDRFVDRLADAFSRGGVDLVHMAEWEPATGTAVFAAADRAGIPWVVMPVDYRLACAQMWLFERGLRDCSGPDETFAKCARCMAVGEPHLDLPHTRLIGLAKKGLYYSGIRPLFPTLLAPRLPRYFDRHGWRRRDETIRRQLQTCRAVITFSDAHGRVLRELLGLPAARFRTLHYPSREPASSYRPSPDRFRPPLRFVWVHRLGREWGPQLLLEGWRRAALPPEQAQLYMYAGTRNKGGAAGWVRAAGYGDLMERGSVVVTEERVHLREDEVYGRVSAYVATPLWKLNAYSADPLGYGFPMIFPRGTALEEIHQDGVNAFAYAQGDPQSLAGVLRRVAADPRLLAEASRNSVFPKDRSPDACGDALLAMYREALESAGASGLGVP